MFLVLRALTRKKNSKFNSVGDMGNDRPPLLNLHKFTSPYVSSYNKSEIFFILMLALDERNTLKYTWRYMHL